MDFAQQNIPEVLKYSMPTRFQDMPPTDFEDFLAQVFRDLGFSVEQTTYSGDFGADLLVSKGDIKEAVQVKRYAGRNKVGVSDVNQIIGAREYYKCSGALIITTSDYTNPARVLMAKTGVESWDWSVLQKILCDIYLGGRDMYEYFASRVGKNEGSNVEFAITKVEYNSNMKRIGSCTLVFASMFNKGANAVFEFGVPIYISKANSQVDACSWYHGYFSSGTVYSGATVEIAFMFKTEQVKYVAVGDRFIFNLRRDGGEVETYDVSVNISSYKACYVATMCYGNRSWEYHELTYFRDNFLINTFVGRWLVGAYYCNGGVLVSLAQRNWVVRKLLGAGVAILACLVRAINARWLRRQIT